MNKCAIGKTHKWIHQRDVTIKNVTINTSGTRIKLSSRGEYRCECGEIKLGRTKGGLQ